MVDNPSKMPDPSKIEEIREPIVTVNLYMPQEYVGSVITLCTQKRGVQIDMSYHGKQVKLIYEMPMAEIVMDFFDKLKSISRGYASMDYEFKEYRAGRCGQGRHADQRREGRCAGDDRASRQQPVSRPRGGGQDARTDSAPDVRRGDPGGDRLATSSRAKTSRRCARTCWPNAMAATSSRKTKLLEKQKAGKKRMKQVGQRGNSAGSILGDFTSGR